MAGQGPAPLKRNGKPLKGDWTQLDALTHPLIPDLDDLPTPQPVVKDEALTVDWPYTTRRYWEAWRKSPVTQIWTEDDLALAIDTIYSHVETVCGGRGIPPSEMRLRMESLGLTPKGRRDHRLILPDDNSGEETHAQVTVIHGGRELPEAI